MLSTIRVYAATNTEQTIHIIFQWNPLHVGLTGNETAELLSKKDSRMSCQPNLPRALHSIIYYIKSKMVQAYLDNIKSTNSNKWVDIDTSSRSLHK